MIAPTVSPTSPPPPPEPFRLAAHTAPASADRRDEVAFSPEARSRLESQRALSRPQALLSPAQMQVKASLLRTFLEILFGRAESEQESPEQETVQAVLDEPATQEALQTLRDNGWIA
ncbi:MAG: hypothetical protein HQL88_06330 [Magnetococcales bacterium]|nr:hypothetical protein [Magnetococcales bacterium]